MTPEVPKSSAEPQAEPVATTQAERPNKYALAFYFAARSVLNHWREFGPKHGFDEVVERMLSPFVAESHAKSAPPQPAPKPEPLSEARLRDVVLAVLRKARDPELWRAMTCETGPYDITELRHEVVSIVRAIEAAHGIWPAYLAPTEADRLSTPDAIDTRREG